MSAREVAAALHVWAQENRLLKTEYPADFNAAQNQENDQIIDAVGISARGESIFRAKGIVGVGFNEARNEVVVFTEKVMSLKDQKVVPTVYGEDVSIRYVHAGLAQAGVPNSGGASAPYVIRENRFACGGSIHPAKAIGAGTLGCLVSDATGELYGLTNNHVSGMSNYSAVGEKILAPGHIDIAANGIDPFTIGYHVRALPMVQGLPDNVDISLNSDAALLKIANPAVVTSYQGALYDTPEELFDLEPGQTVEKVGRTTGYTRGEVVAQMIAPHPVGYKTPGFGDHVSFFEPVFAIKGFGGEPFSQAGDSGSLISINQNGQRYAVGLVFAGDARGFSYALPLRPILDILQVSLVSNHNV